MKVILMDTRAFSMARNLRCNLQGIRTLFLVAASFALSAPAMARDADDVFMPLPMTTAQATESMAFIRPQPRPDLLDLTVQVSRNNIVAPLNILAPETVDRGRIRQFWSIGVFR
jgi:hypothetical protein